MQNMDAKISKPLMLSEKSLVSQTKNPTSAKPSLYASSATFSRQRQRRILGAPSDAHAIVPQVSRPLSRSSLAGERQADDIHGAAER